MVYYYETSVAGRPVTIYRGKDKYENDQLIKNGWDEDVWFHVDDLSSAHIYLRMPTGMSIDTIPTDLLKICGQMTKKNSITGSKQNKVTIVYTMWSNLKKTANMDVGQIGYHDRSQVYSIDIEKATAKQELKMLESTEREVENPDLLTEKEQHLAELRRKERETHKAIEKQKRKEAAEKEKEKETRSYDRLFATENMRSNKDGNDSDDFM